MKILPTLALLTLLASASAAPLRVGIVGLSHGHAGGFLHGGLLTPAGGALHRPDVQIVGVVEPKAGLFDKLAQRDHLAPELHFPSIEAMAAQAHPDAVLVFTAVSEHLAIVEKCAALGIHVMTEKPLALSYRDALAMQTAAERGKIHVLVNYETTWYPSAAAAEKLLRDGALGPLTKAVFRDGHQGPKAIGVGPDFMALLTDPKLGGAGALFDFGCYGADIMTSLMNGEAPLSVTAVTRRFQPDAYPQVDDDAEILLTYAHASAVLQPSWNWPVNLKQSDLYGKTALVKVIDETTYTDKTGAPQNAAPIAAPNDDPLHYLAAVIHNEIPEGNSVTSLKTNITVTAILDAALHSAQTGKTISLPLEP